jgi:hypothetical protein
MPTRYRHCERSEAMQSSVPRHGRSSNLPVGAGINRAHGGTENWIASLRSP